MEALYYYWSIWFVWIMVTFIMEKSLWRTVLGICVLVHIIFSHVMISVLDISINAGFLMTFLYACAAFVIFRPSYRMMRIMQLGSMVSAYAFFMIFALYDPVWFTIIKVDWVVFALLILMCLTYGQPLTERITLWMMSVCLGEALYALTIHRLTSSIVIGDLSFLSFVVQGAVFLLGVDQFEKLLNARSSRKSVKGAAKST
ncbi:YphA family membrane protein [Bacillus sp. FSL M8-0256]|uniref:YphA family membrane protein n=1 Tax=unclassified Bacillus (in: firmicutes) TaxID=185979 RepID=UPI000A879768